MSATGFRFALKGAVFMDAKQITVYYTKNPGEDVKKLLAALEPEKDIKI